MRWKQSLTPLDQVPQLDGETHARLVEHHITTAEELLGQIEAEPAAVAELLGLDDAHVRALGERAAEVIDDDVAAAMSRQRGRGHSMGALPPKNLP